MVTMMAGSTRRIAGLVAVTGALATALLVTVVMPRAGPLLQDDVSPSVSSSSSRDRAGDEPTFSSHHGSRADNDNNGGAAVVGSNAESSSLVQNSAAAGSSLAFKYPCNAPNLRHWRPGKCANDKQWLAPWRDVRPNDEWTLVDVGANKGYVIAEWLELLLGKTTSFTPHHLGIGIYRTFKNMTSGYNSMCGGCCECVEPLTDVDPAVRATRVKVYAFEPSVANNRWLQTFYTNKTLVEVVHAAVSDKQGTAYFPDNKFGIEIGKVVSVPTPGYVPVRIEALDIFFGSRGVERIDVLSTDAEGFDQDVARGAQGFLVNGRVGVYQFEMYRQEDYKTVFERLASWGYACYYFTESRRQKDSGKRPAVPSLIRITGCWQPPFQHYIGWVNGLCYNTKWPHLADIFNRRERSYHRGTGSNCDSKKKQQHLVTHFVSKYVAPLILADEQQ